MPWGEVNDYALSALGRHDALGAAEGKRIPAVSEELVARRQL